MGKTKRLLGPKVKSLKYFLNRMAVLKQYRDFLRITKPLAADVRLDVRRQIRAGFNAYRHEEDRASATGRRTSGLSPTPGAVAASTDTKDTWMDTLSKIKDDQEDVKGRLGTGWPWKRGKAIDKLDLQGIKRR
ncbi:unnamed protein product [Peronospora destructor]|uniref:Uncharacterized protein n=1 Tax=Peronospora destructor TaxID=86335 RepID=A0AAV0V0T9_9STRA|nr:unnamed protein product [Peronospora destructor]